MSLLRAVGFSAVRAVIILAFPIVTIFVPSVRSIEYYSGTAGGFTCDRTGEQGLPTSGDFNNNLFGDFSFPIDLSTRYMTSMTCRLRFIAPSDRLTVMSLDLCYLPAPTHSPCTDKFTYAEVTTDPGTGIKTIHQPSAPICLGPQAAIYTGFQEVEVVFESDGTTEASSGPCTGFFMTQPASTIPLINLGTKLLYGQGTQSGLGTSLLASYAGATSEGAKNTIVCSRPLFWAYYGLTCDPNM